MKTILFTGCHLRPSVGWKTVSDEGSSTKRQGGNISFENGSENLTEKLFFSGYEITRLSLLTVDNFFVCL